MTDEAAISQLLADYYSAFSTLDAEAVLPYFHTPGLFIGPAGTFGVPSTEVLSPMMGAIMDDLRARGYARSELSLHQIKMLSSTAACAGGTVTRYKTDGLELEHAGLTYLFYRSSGGWRITAILLHDPDRSLT
jgi:hypothetical protein